MRTKETKRKKAFFLIDSFDVINGFEMAGIESWASSIMLYELAEKLQRPAISKDLVYK